MNYVFSTFDYHYVIKTLVGVLADMYVCVFGIITEWTKDGEHKKSTISNAAEFMNENFAEHAIQRLNEKIEARTQIGSNWILERINEVFFIITRISNLTRLSGRGYIFIF